MNFVEAMTAAQAGFDTWATKPHNAKWFKRIDGTPIPNDLLVNISEAFVASLRKAAPVAEVVAWRWTWKSATEDDGWAYTETAPTGFDGQRIVQPLYATPQPPSETEESK